MDYTTLISTDELAAYLDDPNRAVFDCRFQLKDIHADRRAYEQAHIPGARYVHLDDDLSGPILPGKTGRHPLPMPEVAAERFGEWGIDSTVQVVAYDSLGGALAAARLWWMLRWLGHNRVAVLDGGWGKWQSEGRPVRGGIEARPARTFVAHLRPELVVDAEDILRRMGDPSFQLFDSRTADRYRGENETIDPVAGHIPGAKSAPYPENLTSQGTFRSVEELAERYRALLGAHKAEETVFYCGSGGTAPQNLLAMLHAGLGEARLYAGSWSGWILDAERPIVTGAE